MLISINSALSKDPTERNPNGELKTAVTSPQFAIDYGLRNPLIRLIKVTSTSGNYQNYIDLLTINTLTVNNITQYSPQSTVAPFIEMDSDVTEAAISTFQITDFNVILGQTGLFLIKNYGT